VEVLGLDIFCSLDRPFILFLLYCAPLISDPLVDFGVLLFSLVNPSPHVATKWLGFRNANKEGNPSGR